MADFKTHLAASTVLGIGYGGAAYACGNVPVPTCLLAGGLCSLSGMLPDIDSGPGRPLREITTFLAAVVPAMLVRRFERYGMSAETVILAAAGIYALIRFGLAAVLRACTVHRGMFHSLPALAICGAWTFLLAYNEQAALRWFTAGGVALGYLSHLLLDEIYSVQWDGLPHAKKSFGTAVKIFGQGWMANIFVFLMLAGMAVAVVVDPGMMQDLKIGRRIRPFLQQVTDALPASWRKSPPPGGESGDQKPPRAKAQRRKGE